MQDDFNNKMSMELTVEAVEALPGVLCNDKFEEEMSTVELVNVSVSVNSEDDAIPIGKKRGRPKKIESPETDGKVFCLNACMPSTHY